MLFNDNLYGAYRTRKFTDIFPSVAVFKEDFTSTAFTGAVTDANLSVLYYLLYARYGNSHIASSDENRFKYDLFGIIFSKGPTWQKKLELQKTLRELSDDDLMYGSKAIYNTAMNPGTETPINDDGTPGEIGFINQQNTTNYKKSKLEAYSILYSLLETDVTSEFINQFSRLFNQWGPEIPLYYVTEGETE